MDRTTGTSYIASSCRKWDKTVGWQGLHYIVFTID